MLDLDGFAIPMEENFNWNNNTHPALHSTAFARNTVIFDQNKYILFGKSLIHHGQPFYACLITSIFFELRILFEFSYEKKEEQEKMKPLDGLLFSDWLTELQKFSSYNIVERSIKNYIEKGVYSSTNFGFLSAFLKNDDSTFAEVERENVIFLDTYSPKVDINETFKGLCPAALDALKKWMCFIDNEAFLRLGLGETLPIIAGNAVEAELKARTSEIDFNALKDIKIESGLKVPPEAKNTSKFQLGNFLHLLKNFSLLTPLSKSKMVGLNRIFKDKDYKEFIETVREISLARNNAGHVSDYTRADDVERTLSVIETLKPKFETCMDILNRTAF